MIGYYERTKENSMKVNSINLLTYVTGFEGDEDFSQEDTLDLFSYLIKTGLCWTLPGYYGRTAEKFIKSGLIAQNGDIL